jgi:intein/homing endonuclease
MINKKWIVEHIGSLPTILIALGINTKKNYKMIPDWIINGSLMTKREFLAGFQGRNECYVYANTQGNTVTFQCSETSQQVSNEYKDALHSYISQLVKLFGDLGVNAYMKENMVISDNRTKIRFNLDAGHKNILCFYDRIGYRYHSNKTSAIAVIVEFMRESGINYSINMWRRWLDNIRCLGNTIFIPITSIVPCVYHP